MYPAAFEYLKPSNISEAIALLQQHGEDAKLLAGWSKSGADDETTDRAAESI